MTGPAPIFEGDLGFMKLRHPRAVRPSPRSAARRQRPFMITETYIKFWPAEYHSQSAIDAALQLRPEIGDVRKRQARSTSTRSTPPCDIIGKDPEKWRPEDPRDGRPQPALLHRRRAGRRRRHADERSTTERFTDPALLDLTAKVKVHRDAALTPRYPRGIPNRLTRDADRRPEAGEGGRVPARPRRQPDDRRRGGGEVPHAWSSRGTASERADRCWRGAGSSRRSRT